MSRKLPVLLLFTSCYTWSPSVSPVRVWEGEQAERVLTPCTRPAPGPVDSLWVPDSAVRRQMEEAVRETLARQWAPGDNDTWVFDGDVAGFYSRGRRLVYGSFAARRSTEPAYPRRDDRVMVWCDGGPRFFGVVYDPATGRVGELEYNVRSVVR